MRVGRFGVVLALVAAVFIGSALVGCSRSHPATTGCPFRDPVQSGPATAAAGSPPAGQPPAVAEALWIADRSGRVRALDGRTDRVAASLDIGGAEDVPALLAGDGVIWAYGYRAGQVLVVDPLHAKVTGRAAVPAAQPYQNNRLLVAHGALWLAQPGMLWRVSPVGAATSSALPPDFVPTAFAATAHALWLAGGHKLLRLDPATGGRAGQADLPSDIWQLRGRAEQLSAIGVNQSQIWLLDPRTGARAATVPIPDQELVTSLVDSGTDELWATGNCGGLFGVAPGPEHRVRTVRVSDVSQDLRTVAALGSLWAADEARAELVRVDPGSARVVARIPVDTADRAFTVFAGHDSVWLVDTAASGGVSRVDTTRDALLPLTSGVGEPGGSAVVAAPPG
jgi:hypothetical protein